MKRTFAAAALVLLLVLALAAPSQARVKKKATCIPWGGRCVVLVLRGDDPGELVITGCKGWC